jgi:beta-glucosidase
MRVNCRLARVAIVLLASTWAFVASAVGHAAGAEPLARTGEAAITWQPLYEPGSGGWITAIASSPHDSRHVLIGGDMLGIAWSDDRGDHWTPSSGLPSYEIGDFTWHPIKANEVWAGSLSGLLKSGDGGKTWQLKRKGFPAKNDWAYSEAIEKILYDPNDPSRLLALGGNSRQWDLKENCGRGAVYESRDGGTTWKLLTRLDAKAQPMSEHKRGGNFMAGAFTAGSSTTVYAALENCGVVVSTDGGKTWEVRNSGLPQGRPFRLFAHPQEPGTLWVSLDCGESKNGASRTPGGVFKSTDGGRNWRSISTGLFQNSNPDRNFTSHYKGFAVSAKHPEVMLAGCDVCDKQGIFLTTDGGMTWSTALGAKFGLPERDKGGEPSGVLADPRDGRKVWASVGGKLYHSSDGGGQWQSVETPRKVYWLAGDPGKPGRFYLTADKGVFVTDDGKTFQHLGGPWPHTRGKAACDKLGRLYIAQWQTSHPGVWRWDGRQWERLLDELFTSDIAVDPNDPNRLALITNDDPWHDATRATGVWVSTDAGKSWAQASTGLMMMRGLCVAFNPHNPEQLVCGTQGSGYFEGRWPKGFTPQATRTYTMKDDDRKHAAPQNSAPPPATDQAANAQPFNLWNGTFTDGGDTPAQWQKEGAATIARDTTVFKTGPASLRVDVSGGTGDALQIFNLKGARKFKLAGFIKTAGGAKAQVVVMPIDAKIIKNQWNQIVYRQGDGDWQHFEKEVSLPDWTGTFRVMLHVEGSGQAWLDDLSVDGAAPADAKPGGAAAEAAEAARPHDDPSRDEPPVGKPWEAGWCVWGWRSAWVGMHNDFVKTTKKGGIDVIFYGDSITMGWKNRWEKILAPLHVVNYGIGGHATRQLLWRIGHGEVDGLKPKLVVLGIGTNNLYGDKNAGSDAEIAKGVEAVVKLLREKLPDTKILLVALLPRQNDYFCNRIKKINGAIANLADDKTARFLNMWDVFMQQEQGTVKDDLYVEKHGETLHPNDKGYDAMTEVMKPVIQEMLK